MSEPTRITSNIRPLGATGAWLTNADAYSEYAQLNFEELKEITDKISEEWPIPLNETIRNPQDHPQIWKLVKKRDSLSDSVLIYTAMAVEAFVNYYGVVRIGEVNYKNLFERLGAIPKLKTLLLVCDSLAVSNNDPLMKVLDKIAVRRNQLVHPKTKEVEDYLPAEERPGNLIPEVAEEAINDMVEFFTEFLLAVPDAEYMIPKSITINA